MYACLPLLFACELLIYAFWEGAMSLALFNVTCYEYWKHRNFSWLLQLCTQCDWFIYFQIGNVKNLDIIESNEEEKKRSWISVHFPWCWVYFVFSAQHLMSDVVSCNNRHISRHTCVYICAFVYYTVGVRLYVWPRVAVYVCVCLWNTMRVA